jgi:HAD superfamily hydrolase (TIGR01509 family)
VKPLAILPYHASCQMNYRAALFDFDGTLTPSLPLWLKAFRHGLESLGHEFADADVVGDLFNRGWEHTVSSLKVDPTDLQREVYARLRDAFDAAELFPESIAILSACRRAHIQTALVTSAPRFILDHVMPRLGLNDVFDQIVTADDVRQFKPHPEPIFAALAALSRAPHEAVMIGDSTADVLAGKAAGTATALFLTEAHADFHDLEALRATAPDHIFSHHRELPRILGLESLIRG